MTNNEQQDRRANVARILYVINNFFTMGVVLCCYAAVIYGILTHSLLEVLGGGLVLNAVRIPLR